MSQKIKDYYDILGLSEKASIDEVKKNYRKLAVKYHPDKNRGDKKSEDKFKEISEAYHILSDPQKKRQYDQSRRMEGSHSFSSLFSSFFSSDNYTSKNYYDENLTIISGIELTLKEGYQGVVKNISFSRNINCTNCKGSGCEKGFNLKQCSECNGRGALFMNLGIVKMQSTCPCCSGKGKIPEKMCSSCNGQGVLKENISLKIVIPAGVMTGQHVVHQKSGNQSKVNPEKYGDLILKIHIVNDDIFSLTSSGDICIDMPVPIYMAIVGGEIEVPTLEGNKKINIPPKTENDKIIKIPNAGYKENRYMMVNIKHEMPSDDITEENKNKIIKGLSSKKYQKYNKIKDGYSG